MKLGTGSIGSLLNRYGGTVGALHAAYNYYADRGIDGFMTDIQAIASNPMGLKNKMTELGTGIAVLVITPMVVARVPNSIMKGVIKYVGNYYGYSQILGAIRSGAGYGAGRGYVPAQRRMVVG